MNAFPSIDSTPINVTSVRHSIALPYEPTGWPAEVRVGSRVVYLLHGQQIEVLQHGRETRPAAEAPIFGELRRRRRDDLADAALRATCEQRQNAFAHSWSADIGGDTSRPNRPR
jgi:hypothetical protein